MKKVMMAITVLAFSGLVMAQQGPPMDLSTTEKAEAKTKRMIEKGMLDESAYEAAYKIHLEGAEELDALREEHHQQRDKMEAEKRAIMEEKGEAIKALMTDEQKAQFELQKEKHKLHQEERALRHKKHHLMKVEKTKEYLRESDEG